MENPNLAADAMLGRIAALEWMVAQLYALAFARILMSPEDFFAENRRMIAERMKDWRLPSSVASQAAVEAFERIFSIAEAEAAIINAPSAPPSEFQ